MKEAMFFCTVIAVAGALLRLFVETAGSKAAAKFIGTVTGLLIALTLAGAVIGSTDLRFSVTAEDREDDFLALSEETMDAVCAEAEARLSSSLAGEIENTFGVPPKECRVAVDRESLGVCSVTVIFYKKDFLVGSYEIKKYVGENYGAEAEVYFE